MPYNYDFHCQSVVDKHGHFKPTSIDAAITRQKLLIAITNVSVSMAIIYRGLLD